MEWNGMEWNGMGMGIDVGVPNDGSRNAAAHAEQRREGLRVARSVEWPLLLPGLLD